MWWHAPVPRHSYVKQEGETGEWAGQSSHFYTAQQQKQERVCLRAGWRERTDSHEVIHAVARAYPHPHTSVHTLNKKHAHTHAYVHTYIIFKAQITN